MAYEKQTWVSYDDNKTEEQNIQDGAVVTAERMNHLENGLDQHGKDTTNPHKVTKAQVGLSDVTNVEQASKTDFNSHLSSKTNPHGVTKTQVGLSNVDNYGTASQAEAEIGSAPDKFMTPLRTKQYLSSRMATQTEAEGGTSSEKLMTPLRTKQHVDKRIATQTEVTDGEANDKLLSPKGLADTIKFTEVFLPGSTLSNVAIEGTLVPHGNTAGGSLNYIKNRPYTVNSDGSFTFKRATNLLVTGGMKLVVGDTNPTDYLYINAYVNNALNEFIALGATAATNGTLRLTWSAMGQRVISVNSGDVLSLKIGLRSGKQAFAVQLTSLKIEEV
ncbi:hypothetical protein SAMN04487821_11582 [Enterococcus malodoratus]|uniref:hypothetical protein n=1 Tax=Enterococcus malodoratus TaxID=71451 RepID=UPI0008BB397A|nr:hypothetical protein SAMN04487821_11582 [Enterococcus malodoratus]